MTGCQTCGGFGNRHDPVAHGTEPEMSDAMPPHPFVDTGVIALDYPGASHGRPVCGWNEDGEGACDRYINDPIHTGFVPLGATRSEEIQ